jgi:hypothetical protein
MCRLRERGQRRPRPAPSGHLSHPIGGPSCWLLTVPPCTLPCLGHAAQELRGAGQRSEAFLLSNDSGLIMRAQVRRGWEAAQHFWVLHALWCCVL